MSGINLLFLGAVKVVPTTIGQAFGGGFYTGQVSYSANGVPQYYLIVAPKSSGQSAGSVWKTTNTATSGTDSPIDGLSNSNNMNNASHPPAQFCRGLSIGGFTDWYMPARYELEICYYNLRPTSTNNTTSFGANSYAIPPRASNYTSSVPGQTSAADFKSPSGAERFDNAYYWSSTQDSSSTGRAWQQYFFYGVTYSRNKDNAGFPTRAIRKIAI